MGGGSDVENLDYDVLVLSEDIYKNIKYKTINVNRQIISTKNGLNKANKKYILKLRTDALLINNTFLEYFDKFPNRNKKYIGFKNRVIVSSIFSREYSCLTKLNIPFHPSDMYLFGLTYDLKDYFMSSNQIEIDELYNYKRKYNNIMPYKNECFRYYPEQLILLNWAKTKFENINFEDLSCISYENHKKSLNILYNNFIFLDLEQSGISIQKYKDAFENSDKIPGIITFELFKKRYKELCCNKIIEESKVNEDNYIYYFNQMIGYIDYKTNTNSTNTNQSKNLFDIIGNFLFSIKYFDNKIVIIVLGINITLKNKNC